MKILIVGIKNNPQVERLKGEAINRGHELSAVLSSELSLYFKGGNPVFLIGNIDISSLDLIYLWTVEKRRWEWYAASQFLTKKYKIKIVGELMNPSPIAEFLALWHSHIPIPKTAVICSYKEISKVSKNFSYPVILKAAYIHQGKSVSLVKSKYELVSGIERLKKEFATSIFIVRKVIRSRGDIRVFCLGGKAVAAMKRFPLANEFRANISQGAKGKNLDLQKYPDVKDLAERSAKALDIEIAGVDIIIDEQTKEKYVLEVNSGPQFSGIEKYTNINIAAEIIKYFEILQKKI